MKWQDYALHISGLTLGAYLGTWSWPYLLAFFGQGQYLELVSPPVRFLLIPFAVVLGLLTFKIAGFRVNKGKQE